MIKQRDGIELLKINTIPVNWLAGLAFIALAGCQTSAPDPMAGAGTLDQSVHDELVFIAEPGLSSGERLRKAIDLLAQGDAGQAEAELQAYLAEVQGSKIAGNLLRQVITPIDQLYPEAFVQISMLDGDSLSTIAKQYLGDPLQFYGLARYNQIAKPGRTSVGQLIKVPLTQQAKNFLAVRSQSPEIADLPDSLEPVELVVDTVNLEDLIVDRVDDTAALSDLAAISLSEDLLLDEITQSQEITQLIIEDNVSEFAEQAPANNLVLGLLGDENYKGAIAEFEALDNKTSLDRATLDGVIDAYHREASQAFRHQDLDLAIELWEKVMVLDPEHAHASNSLIQAQELRQKLGRLE